MNLVGRLRAAKKADEKAAATAPAKFRRITKRAKVTAPCVLAVLDKTSIPYRWQLAAVTVQTTIDLFGDRYTHWLPIQWPEVRG